MEFDEALTGTNRRLISYVRHKAFIIKLSIATCYTVYRVMKCTI